MTASTGLDDTLANIRARTEAATEGPWVAELSDGDVWAPGDRERICRTSSYGYHHDAEFIAHARTDVPRLLDLLDEQRAVIARVREICAEPDDTQWWPVQPYMDPPNEDEVVEVQVIAADRLLAVLDGADTTTTDGDAVTQGDTHA